ncbi:MAG: hypothetical protein AAF587_15525 [Bacteroidota bacterium]
MKYFYWLLLCGFLSSWTSVSAEQGVLDDGRTAREVCDLIILKDGEEIEAKVLEIEIKTVKYKRCSFVDGPTYTLKQSDIFMIKYSDGSKDVFADNNPLKALIPKGRKRTHRSADEAERTIEEASVASRKEKAKPQKKSVSKKSEQARAREDISETRKRSVTDSGSGEMQEVRLNYSGGFFVKDVRMTILWDGEEVGEGSFKNGFSLTFPSEAGAHKLLIDIGFRKYKYDIELSGREVPDIQFKYDRMFGRLLIDKKKSSF